MIWYSSLFFAIPFLVDAQKCNIGYLLQMVAMPYYLIIFNNILIGGTPFVTMTMTREATLMFYVLMTWL
jgi:hypothetical protein